MKYILFAVIYTLLSGYVYAGTVTFTASPQRGTIPLSVSVSVSWSGLTSSAASYSVDGGDSLDGNGGAASGTSGNASTTVTYQKVGTYPMVASITDVLSGVTYSTATYITVDPTIPTFSGSGRVSGSSNLR